jgi:hypothetical protein
VSDATDPYPLKPGHDYHLAEVHRRASAAVLYAARCEACGWIGPDRSKRSDAEEDAYAHDTSHNPGGGC